MVIRRKFSREFKLAAVARVRAGESVAEVARACEVNSVVSYRSWCANVPPGSGLVHKSPLAFDPIL